MSDTIKVKRDGPRGWHNIAAASFDPDKHERYEAPDAPKSGDRIPGDIPDDWEALHWKSKVALGMEIMGDEWNVPEGGKPVDVADAAIRAKLEADAAPAE